MTINLYGQGPTKKQIDKYVRAVDSLKTTKKLKKYFYPEMSLWGGALYGYYQNNKLVLIDASHGGEFGANSYKIYLKDTIIYKLQYNEYWGDQDTYAKRYPKDEEIDEKKLTYTDTLYTLYLSARPTYIKSSRGKIISRVPSQKQIDYFLSCGHKMRAELETEKITR